MAGLLGDGWDDPQSQMMMGLAQGLLSARGGAGLAAGLGNMQASQDGMMKRKLMQTELSMKQLAEQRAQAMFKMQQEAYNSIPGGQSAPVAGGSSDAPAPASSGALLGGAPASPASLQGAGNTSAELQRLERMAIAGVPGAKESLDIYKYKNTPQQLQPGTFSQNPVTGAREYIPDVKTGITYGANGISLIPGSENLATLEGQKAGAVSRAQAGSKPIKVWNEKTQRDEWTTEAAVTGGQQSQGGPAPAGGMPGRTGNPMIDAVMQTESGGNPNAVSPAGARGLMQVMPGTNTAPGFGVAPARDNSEAERTRVGKDYHGAMMERYKDPALAAIAYNWGPGNTDMWLKSGGDYNKLPAETKSYVSQVMTRNGVNAQGGQAPQQAPAQSGNYAAGPSSGEASNAAATKEYATQAAKDQAEQRKGIMNAGFTAPSTIAKYQQLGKLLEGVDGGTLTATGTHLASTMNSLGFKIDKNLPNKEAAAALGNQMALELRSPANGAGMPGAMSDADRQYLVSMIPNAGQSLQGRKQMIEAQISISQRQQQVANFARNYEKKYGQLDNGFFGQMQAWSEANPLFSKGQ